MKEEIYDSMYSDEESHWWYVARRKIITSEVGSIFRSAAMEASPSSWRLLDYGCGTGRNLVEFAKLGVACGLDASADALEYCRQRGLQDVALAQPEELAAGKNPFGEPFDLLVLSDVLEHLDDDVGMLKQLAALLKPDGRVLITVPAYEFLWSGEDYVSHHRRRYRLRGLASVVRSAGFEVEQITYFNALLFPLQVCVILFNRLFRPKSMFESNVQRTPAAVNAALEGIFSAEAGLLKRIRFPFGGSILCRARRLPAAAH